MKNLRSIFTLLVGMVIFSTCEQDELTQPVRLGQKNAMENGISRMRSIKLISKKLLTVNEIQKERSAPTVDGWYPAPYASSIPIYRYLYYGSYENIDHYYGVQKSSSLSIHGITYSYERQEFNIMPNNNLPDLIGLYRHYSSTERDHILSTASYIASYTSDGIIGYIYMHPQVGTVPLLEYYSSKRRSHLYVVRNTEVEWILQKDTDFLYVKTVGYVYPGSAIDEKKEATNFIITQGVVLGNPLFRLNMKVREGDKYWELFYEVEEPGKGLSVTIPINNTYTVVSCIPIIETTVPYYKPLIDEITYPIGTFSYGGWNVKKTIDGYDVKLEYFGAPPL